MKGLGFCEDLDPGEECARVCVDLVAETALCRCQNPGQGGENCGGLGDPFFPDTPKPGAMIPTF